MSFAEINRKSHVDAAQDFARVCLAVEGGLSFIVALNKSDHNNERTVIEFTS